MHSHLCSLPHRTGRSLSGFCLFSPGTVLIFTLLLTCIASENITAQVTSEIAPTTPPGLLKKLYLDQKYIWTAPLRLEKKKLQFIAPLFFTTGILINNDERTHAKFISFRNQRDWMPGLSRRITHLGDGSTNLVVFGSFYMAGRLMGNERAKETAALGIKTFFHTGFVVQVLKHAFWRQRPAHHGGKDKWHGAGNVLGHYQKGKKYTSFPSGHSCVVFGMATVIAKQYKEHKIIPILSYTLASAAALSRITENRHWSSDVLIGSALGHVIANYIVKSNKKMTAQASANRQGATAGVRYSF